MDNWISVEDRLPNDESEILFVYSGLVYVGRFLGYGPDKETPRWESENVSGYMAVTHWQPLPPPPEA